MAGDRIRREQIRHEPFRDTGLPQGGTAILRWQSPSQVTDRLARTLTAGVKLQRSGCVRQTGARIGDPGQDQPGLF